MKFSELKNRSVAVGLFGVSYKESYDHWMGWKTRVDWRRSNYKDTVLSLLLSGGNKVCHYLATYTHELVDELVCDFSPKKKMFGEFGDCENFIGRHRRFGEVLDLFDEDHDYYIITRFDLCFSMDALSECEIKEGAINVTSKHSAGEDRDMICDNFYVFDRASLEGFKNFIKGLKESELSNLYSLVLDRYENSPEFSFLLDGSYYSHNCPLWGIVR